MTIDHHLYDGEDRTIVHTTHADSFGLVLPRETGIHYRHQSGGMACSQVHFEGVLIPLKRPRLLGDAAREVLADPPDEEFPSVDLVTELSGWDYPGESAKTRCDWDSREEIWSRIEDALRFDFDLVAPTDHDPEEYPAFAELHDGRYDDFVEIPEGYPEHGAAFEWVRINGVETETTMRGGVEWERPRMRVDNWAEKLAGELAVLLYQNCD